jgi:hypothetical protein
MTRKNNTIADNAAGRTAAQAGALAPGRLQGLHPPISLDGRPLLFVAVEGSALMMNACPISIAYTANAASLPASHLIRPTADWGDKNWDHAHLSEIGQNYDDLLKRGAPAVAVAEAAQAAADEHCLVMQQPGLEKIWLTELLLLQPADIRLSTVSLTSLAILLADRIGLDEDALAGTVAGRWFKLIARRKAPADWVIAAAALVQMLLDEGVRRGLIEKDTPVVLKAPERASGKRSTRRPAGGGGA